MYHWMIRIKKLIFFERKKKDDLDELNMISFRTSTQINSAIDVMKIFKTQQVISILEENDQFYQHNGSSLSQIKVQITIRERGII